MVFKKLIKNSMDFVLLNLDARESFSVWDNDDKKYYRDELRGSDNQLRKVETLKKMPKDEFIKLYPNCSKKTQFIRDIAIQDGYQWFKYQFGFSSQFVKKGGEDDKLRQNIETLQKAGVNPLEFIFTLRVNGTGLDKSCVVVTQNRVGVITNAIEPVAQQTPQQQIPIQQPQPNIPQNNESQRGATQGTPVASTGASAPATSQQQATKPVQNKPVTANKGVFSLPSGSSMQNYIVLTKEEQQVLDDAEEYTEKLSEQQFIDGFRHSMMKTFKLTTTTERATEIYRQHYVK